MNRGGARIYTGQLSNVGTSYATLLVSSPENPPERGWISQVIVEILSGTGTQVAAKIEDIPVTGHNLELHDGADNPVDAPINDAANRVWYQGLSAGIPVEVKVEAGADSVVKVTLVVEVPS